MAEPLAWPVRVYWEDTDAGGVVYHARYLAFMERARTEWLRTLGHDQELLRGHDDLVFVVSAMQLQFRAPARLDDQLAVSVALLKCGSASFVVGQRVSRDGQALLDATVRIGALRGSDFRPRAMPDTLRRQLLSKIEEA